MSGKPEAPRDGLDSWVSGVVLYKGRTYYIAGRPYRVGRMLRVEHVTTRDKILLYFRDGSTQFWAGLRDVRVERAYTRPQTIRGLQEYAAEAKRASEEGPQQFRGRAPRRQGGRDQQGRTG